MLLLAVQEERGPRKPKKSPSHSIEPRKVQKPIMNVIQPVVKSTLNCHHHQYRILTQILVSCVRQARCNEHFRHFAKDQQDVILELVWFECFLMRAANWTIDIVPILESLHEPHLRHAIEKIKLLRIDLIELTLLETLILCRKEFGLSEITIKHLELINDGAILALGKYVLQQGYPWTRYGKLLLALRTLTVNFESFIQNVLFKNIIKDVIIDTV